MKLIDKQTLRDLHRPGWAGARLVFAYTNLFVVTIAATVWAISEELYPLVAVLVLFQTFVMQAGLIGFHEASHGSLCPVPAVNGFLGRTVGIFSFMSLTLYRAAHHWHHAYLGDIRDEEFWPYNEPTAGKWKRRLAAFCELVLGLLWTPLLFLRSFLRPGTRILDRATRRLIWAELLYTAVFWVAVVAVCVWQGWLVYLLFAYLIPAALAGNAQSLRKHIEHVGLTGASNVELTRSVRDETLVGRAMSWLLFHEPLHDVHHLYPKLPQETLPAAAKAEQPVPPELPVFPNYRAAFGDLLKCLPDPRFGRATARAPGGGVPGAGNPL